MVSFAYKMRRATIKLKERLQESMNNNRVQSQSLNTQSRQSSFDERMNDRIVVRAGENSVVDNRRLPKLGNNRAIILTDDVYQTLKMIGDISNQQGKEVPFLLFGKLEESTGFFVVDRWEAEPSVGAGNDEAVFSEQLVEQAFTFATTAEPKEHKILFHGHSHPRHGRYYLNYSLGDVNAYQQMRKKPWMKNVLFGGCLLTGGNFNFSFCDGTDLYKFDNVFVQKENGDLVRLSAFGPDIDIMLRSQHRGYNV